MQKQGLIAENAVMDYLDWNDAIAEYFFQPDSAGRRVHLYVAQDTIRRIGEPRGCGPEDFVEAVKEGYGIARGKGICEAASTWVESRDWRRLNFEYPPYIAYLAFFVYAAGRGEEGEYHTNAYYRRLNDLIEDMRSQEGDVGSQEFAKVDQVWEDLERWTTDDREGRLGYFQVHRAGLGHHVGIPVAQALLTERERQVLERIFAKAGLDPKNPPSQKKLASVVYAKGRDALRPATARRLEGEGTAGLREILLDTITETLEEWDGTYSETSSSAEGEESEKTRYGGIFLCLDLSPFGDLNEVQARCKTSHSFPEEGFELTGESVAGTLTSEEHFGNWSTRIRSESGALDASSLDWMNGSELRDEDKNWTFKLSPSPVRIFVEGGLSEGLPRFVETEQLPLGEPIFVAVRNEKAKVVQEWGEKHCTGMRSLGAKGLPAGWKLYKVDAVQSDRIVRDHFDKMALSAGVRLSLREGITLSRRSEYFSFAPPKARVRSREPVDVYCNDELLEEGKQATTCELPGHLLSERTLSIEVRRAGDVLKKRRLFLHDQFDETTVAPDKHLDKFGIATESEGVGGAVVNEVVAGDFNLNTFIRLPSFKGKCVFLLGRKPGQVAKWPKEPLPDDWQAVWAVPMGKRSRWGRAVFCGQDLGSAGPDLDGSGYSKSKQKSWRWVLHVKRRVIDPPSDPETRELWMKYREVAEDVA